MTPADTSASPLDARASTPAPTALRRVSEGELAYAIADWFAGQDFTAQDAMWLPYKQGVNVQLRAQGDTLFHREIPVATRVPVPATIPGPKTAAVSDARAVCAVVARGDHQALYGPRA
ncbi:hypothetical protein [Caulobacter vibrioides]|uniref:Uncharacterized protein n=1 Tax=Caulobacter phage S2B TaxID=2759120 RepID=A0AAE7SY53_9CAUD|nr:hypothetical protein [Caulobacter vibrioides]QOC54117.1 hypothetical protein [Caulobacter phage S2B]QXZ50203.1 hypothetical protein KZH45_09730 [Caulobacter vibrioides]